VRPFTEHTGRVAPLRRNNVDTDQIIPAEWCKRISRTGFEDGLFARWRDDPEFVLNRPERAGATVLAAGPDFGIGSSREHAVWALQDFGFRVVVSSRFGDIFTGNALKAGLLPVRLPADEVAALMAAVEADPALAVTVDLVRAEVRFPGYRAEFPIDGHARYRLLAGLDDIGVTETYLDVIEGYERTRRPWLPVTRELRASTVVPASASASASASVPGTAAVPATKGTS